MKPGAGCCTGCSALGVLVMLAAALQAFHGHFAAGLVCAGCGLAGSAGLKLLFQGPRNVLPAAEGQGHDGENGVEAAVRHVE